MADGGIRQSCYLARRSHEEGIMTTKKFQSKRRLNF